MNSAFSLMVRAWLALLLMVGFYFLAVGLAGGLFYIPYAEIVYAHRVHPKLWLACIVGGGAILFSILPRWDSFEAPGPRLDPTQHPRLFAMLTTVAKATGQTMPSDVYLIPDVNAFVTSRGGFMGFLSRRVMGLGAPLLQVLTVSEFKAVIAHEFGHYVGGDVGLGPWIYKTRGAIVRTVQNLGEGSLLQLPFVLYANIFFKITFSISRHQEYNADRLAANTIGAKPLVEGLRKIHGAGMAFQSYWSQEVAPVLDSHFKPPLMEGFQKFLKAESVSSFVAQEVAEHEKSGKSEAYDSHPSLKERIEAVRGLPDYKVEAQDWPAFELLNQPDNAERELVAFLAHEANAEAWPGVAWDEVGMKVLLPGFREQVKKHFNVFNKLTLRSVPEVSSRLAQFGRNFMEPGMENGSPELFKTLGIQSLSAATVVALSRQGWEVVSLPGDKVRLRKNGMEMLPFDEIKKLAEGEAKKEDWEAQMQTLGIEEAPLQTE